MRTGGRTLGGGRRVALLAGPILLLLSMAAWYAVRTLTHGPLPDHDGVVVAPSLGAEVEVLRDEHGVAHVFAESLPDLLFAQGYVHAQDRFFTMDFYRRVARGELAALLGAEAEVVETDVLMRTLDLGGAAERDLALLSAEERALLEAFAAGVNSHVEGRPPRRLAVEYGILALGGLSPEVPPWRPEDSLAVARLMSFAVSASDLTREIEREAVAATLPPGMARQWRPPYDYEAHPTVLKGTARQAAAPGRAVRGRGRSAPPPRLGLLQRLPLASDGAGSNAFVLDGSRTASGRAILAVDPHGGIEMPSLWHEVGLHLRPEHDESVTIYGFAAAPLPLVLDGRNDHAAWGTTNVTGGDTLDLFRLRLHPDDPELYHYEGGWRRFEATEASVRAADGTAFPFTIRRSAFGPLLPGEVLEPGGVVHGVRWTGFAPSTITRASLRLPFVRSFEEMRATLEDWGVPPTNFLYAGRDGTIGFQQAGRFPIRAARTDGLTPQDGTGPEADWRGILPYHLMPSGEGSAEGFLVSGNNPPVGPGYFDRALREGGLSGDADYLRDVARGYRAHRIEALLGGEEPVDRARAATIQTDVTVPSLPPRLAFVRGLTVPEDARACRDVLARWNGGYDVDSAGALVFAELWTTILDEVYRPHLPEGVPLRVGMTELASLEAILADASSGWWDDPATEATERRDDRVAAALTASCARVRARHGDDPTRWRWGDAHRADFVPELLGQVGIGPVERWASRRGVEVSGGPATVSVARWRHGAGFGPVHVASYRMIVDWSRPDEVMVVSSTGQSSHPASPHYADQVADWAAGRYRVVTLTDQAIRERAAHRLVLTPEGRP